MQQINCLIFIFANIVIVKINSYLGSTNITPIPISSDAILNYLSQ